MSGVCPPPYREDGRSRVVNFPVRLSTLGLLGGM